jgi:hypothetical protein
MLKELSCPNARKPKIGLLGAVFLFPLHTGKNSRKGTTILGFQFQHRLGRAWKRDGMIWDYEDRTIN